MARNKRVVPKGRKSKVFDAEIANSSRLMRIEITPADIKAGIALDPTGCAAAQAVLRATNATAVKVHRGMSYLKLGNKWVRFKTSGALRLETIIFDRGGQFMPGQYDLQPVPLATLKQEAKQKISPTKGYKGTQAKLRTRRTTIPGVRKSVYQKGDE